MSRSWYEIKNQAAPEADVYVYDEIGCYGISAKEFVRDLRAVSAPLINLHVNSPGGDVFDGVAIYNSLKQHKAAVHVFIDGIAASSASFIAQAGDRVVMAPSATMMIHEPYGLAMGDAGTMAKMAGTLDKVGDTIASIYAERAGGTEAEWRQRMQAETWYRAQEAVSAGLADEMSSSMAPANMAPRLFNLSKFRNVPEWLQQPADAQPRAAGRTMSQANLDKLHAAMQGLDAVHGGTCDMGAECPVGGAQNRVPALRNEDLTVCLAPECDMPAVLELPLCKDHVEAIMGAGQAPLNTAKDEGVGQTGDRDDIYRYRAALLEMEGTLALAGGTL